ncbi:DUF3438 family protein [Methylophaga sp. OBS4]|uniref:DUF3438 family protein n=1 Tax=Methylophaga sp. OBS4 TaxID=2991935 RepID=UPI00225597E8|nr:DUF3438 family protein [Methylophaga sp. OBS4]MCX4187787.1 DUF3438 family protein [Methylophaga sp. OBS4]
MKKTTLLTGLLAFTLLFSPARADIRINELEFSETDFIDVIRTLSEFSDSNIIATPEATQTKVTIHLKNTTVVDAIKSIARISDLWYRYDEDTDTYRIMSREEYGKDLIVRESEHIEVFKLLNANVQIIAQAIEDLYGNRVILSLGTEPGQNNLNGSSSNSNRSGVRNSRSTTGSRSNTNRNSASRGGVSGSNNLAVSGNQVETEQLSIDQIERLANLMNTQGSSSIDTETLQQITVQAQPIYITVNNEHNMIIVRTDDRKVIQSIQKLIDQMDIPVPQVMLEMKILSVILGEDFNSIFNFELQPSGSNQSQQPILLGNNALLNTGSFIYEFLNSRLRANLEFLEQNRRVKVLSNPMVLASNHREAELFIGEESILTRGFTFNPATVTATGTIVPSFVETETELEEIGITLRITPRINSDDTVTLELEQESSTINPGGGTIPVADGEGNVLNLSVDTVNTARLTGTVLAKDGLTVAVGGLIRSSKSNSEKKVPVLSEIPVIGRVFRNNIETEEDTETVLLITPRILNTPEDSEKIRQRDNRFYQDHNRGYPDLEPFPNKFINKDKPVTASADTNQNRQQTYMEMSQFAADTIRVPEIERLRNDLYQPVSVNRQPLTHLFNDKRVQATPQASWNRGGLHVTAVEVTNRSGEAMPVDFQQVNGKWLASLVESSVLAAQGNTDDRTYLYLISALPFNEVVAGIN